LKRTGKNKGDKTYLKRLGLRISLEIEAQGFSSPYDFWIKRAEGKISRTTLNYILNGKIDAKITTLKAIAKLLKLKPHQLIDLRSLPKPNPRSRGPIAPAL